MNQTHYPASTLVEAVNRHTLAVVVDNEPGVLARIAGLFSGRGYNIESLTVSETQHETHVSRITIVTAGTAAVIEQIKAQLERLVPVHRVDDLTVRGEALERELCLVKVAGEGEHRVEALRLASAFGARTLDATLTSFVFELTGASEDIERFVKLMAGVGLVEVARTGIAAMSRGAESMEG
jgi:acetolactate synthase-1/3 small subunit